MIFLLDYPINYDDINSLLKKYGIEPLQPIQSNQSPVKLEKSKQSPVKNFEKEQVLSGYTAYQPEPQPMNTTYTGAYKTDVQHNNYSGQNSGYIEQQPMNDVNKFQNYSEILKNYEEKGHDIQPGYERERKEEMKRTVNNKEPNEEIYKYQYKPAFETNNNNEGVGSDYYSNYNRPSDMGQEANVFQNFGVGSTKVQEISVFQQQEQIKKPSLYDNVSFTNEFFETKPKESKLEKKNSIAEMKKSINKSGKTQFFKDFAIFC